MSAYKAVAPDNFLYVLPKDIPEAMSMGALYIKGDTRLIMPRPVPTGLSEGDFVRWRTLDAVNAWLAAEIEMHLSSLLPPDEDNGPPPAIEDEMDGDKILLYVPLKDVEDMINDKDAIYSPLFGVFYVLPTADMNKYGPYMTEQARQKWWLERTKNAQTARQARLLAIAALYADEGRGSNNSRNSSDGLSR